MIHRTGTIECYHSSNITEVGWLQFLQIAPHSSTFQLEDAAGFAGGEELKRPGVIQGKMLQVKVYPSTSGNNILRSTEGGQIDQPQQVKLEQTDTRYIFHAKLGHRHTLCFTLAHQLKGDMFNKRFL